MQFNQLAVNYDVMPMMAWLYRWDNFIQDLPGLKCSWHEYLSENNGSDSLIISKIKIQQYALFQTNKDNNKAESTKACINAGKVK